MIDEAMRPATPAANVYDETMKPNSAGPIDERAHQLWAEWHDDHEVDDAGELHGGEDQQHDLFRASLQIGLIAGKFQLRHEASFSSGKTSRNCIGSRVEDNPRRVAPRRENRQCHRFAPRGKLSQSPTPALQITALRKPRLN